MTVWLWSATADENDDIDGSINLRANQAPRTYPHAMRAIIAAVAKWRNTRDGVLVTGGSSTVLTITTSAGLTLADGRMVRARMHATSGLNPTLNVDGTGAVALQTAQGAALPLGALLVGGIYSFTYYAASAAWIVHGVPRAAGKYVGEIFDYGGRHCTGRQRIRLRSGPIAHDLHRAVRGLRHDLRQW